MASKKEIKNAAVGILSIKDMFEIPSADIGFIKEPAACKMPIFRHDNNNY